MKKTIFILALIVFTGIFTGCSNSENQYEGKWVSITKNDWDSTNTINKMEIKKNGENYIINTSKERYKDTGPKTIWSVVSEKPINATLKDEKLVLNPSIVLTFIKSDKTILGPKGELYKKETPEELDRLKKETMDQYKKQFPKETIEE